MIVYTIMKEEEPSLSERYLYLMISKTDTQLGRFIRSVSHFPYNHVSMSLDSSFHHWVSFGRYNREAPLYSGFITESPERYLAKGFDTEVRIFRLPVTRQRYEEISNLFSHAGEDNCGLVYNTFDCMAAAFHRRVVIPGAYTCLSFACEVIGKKYLSIEELDQDLRDLMIYDGPLDMLVPDSGSRTDRYFDHHGLIHGTWMGAVQLTTLMIRFFAESGIDLAQFYYG